MYRKLAIGIVLTGCLLILIMVTSYVNFFGFNFSDEGYNVLLTSIHQPPEGLVIRFGRIISYLNRHGFTIGIVEQRFVRLILLVISSYSLARSLKRWAQRFSFEWSKYSTTFIILSGFTSYLWYPNAFTYNSLTTILIQFYLAVILRMFMQKAMSFGRMWSYSIVLAALIYLLFLVKFSVSVSVFILTLMIYGVLAGFKIINRRGLIIIPILTFCLFVVGFIAKFNFPSYSFSEIIDVIRVYTNLSTTHTFVAIFTELAHFLWFLFAFILIGVLISKSFVFKSFHLLAFAFLLFGFSISWNPVRFTFWNGTFLFATFEFIFLGIYFYRCNSLPVKKKFGVVLLCCILLLFTVASFGGTDNPNIMAFANSSALILPIFLFSDDSSFRGRLIGSISIFLTFMVIIQLTILRYRQPSILHQNIKYKPPIGTSIFLSADEILEINSLKDGLSDLGFKPGDAIVFPYAKPGLVYLMNGYAPGGILWSKAQQDAYFYILKNNAPLPDSIFVISEYPEFIHVLNSEINFNYEGRIVLNSGNIVELLVKDDSNED